jgi:hypothetical protein
MKKVMFALLAFLLSASVVSAATVSVSDNSVTVNVVDEKVKIKPEELPDAVKMALNSPDYTGWQINAAYKYSETEIYEVELKNGTEVTTVKFDKDGKKVE